MKIKILVILVLGTLILANTGCGLNKSIPAAESGPELTEPVPVPTPEITLVAVGDIMLSRHVNTKIVQSGDWRSPFIPTHDVLATADITFGNLETPISDRAAPPLEGMSFISSPKNLEGLSYAGFDVLSLANNHLNNFGAAAAQDTVINLSTTGISGVGLDDQPIIIERNGLRIGFLAYSDAPGTTGVNYLDVEQAKKDIATLKPVVDVVVVSVHTGVEYERTPRAAAIAISHDMVDAGAKLILGHHPHVTQTAEEYNGGHIIYSLGNFVFDQMWSEATRESYIFRAKLSAAGVSGVEFLPIKIYDYYQPRLEINNK